MPRKLLIVALLVLLIPMGTAAAQSSTDHVIQRSVTVSGGAAKSANYAVTTAIGQPSTDIAGSVSFKVSGGFLFPHRQDADGNRVWLPVVQR